MPTSIVHKTCLTLGLLVLTLFPVLGQTNLYNEDNALDSIAYSMEEALENPLSIKVLDLRKQKLKELPNRFDRLVNIHTIYLDRNKLDSLPPSIVEAKGLKYLSLANNKFEKLPELICQFAYLETLDISNNYIPELPDCMSNLIHLKELLMVGADIGKIPTSMSEIQLELIDMRIIQMNEKEQQAIKDAYPEAVIRFSKPCNCFGDEDEDDEFDDEY